MNSFEDNKAARLASKFINTTNKHIFLTGKAGTGKTTFSREIRYYTHKNTVVAAPTGIAAINAEGVTLHSLFQLPFGLFIPSNNFSDTRNRNFEINTPNSLLKGLQINSRKRNMLREIELLIIDEVSMLRADVLDAADTILRHIRRNNAPFGGVQMLFIGDLQQLPPVVKKREKAYIRQFYKSGFFFEAVALKNNKPVYLELEKVYRQSDQQFISILNNLRDNVLTRFNIETLNSHYIPGFKAANDENFVYLTTHNYRADQVNTDALRKLQEEIFTYKAKITSDFKPNLYPVDPVLELKKDAQVMFIKNDPSGNKKFFNGKIGKVSNLTEDDIEVIFDDGSDPVTVELYTWENKRYTLDNKTNEIQEKVIGKFVHYPIKLAWAITVHKSQGLTFEKAIIDVANAFAAGQIYVALSRLTSLDGLVLTSPIGSNGIEPDRALKEYNDSKEDLDSLMSEYKNASTDYINQTMINSFNFSFLYENVSLHVLSYSKEENLSVKQKYVNWAKKLLSDIEPITKVADSFIKQINKILNSGKADYLIVLNERVIAARDYFRPIFKDLSQQVINHIKIVNKEKRTKQYSNELNDLDRLFFSQQKNIDKAAAILNAVINNTELTKQSFQGITRANIPVGKETEKTKKPNTKELSLQLFKEGKSIEDIAKERTLAVSTIEGHLSHWVKTGDINVSRLVKPDKVKTIVNAAKELDTNLLAPIKQMLGDDYSYSELRFAISSLNVKSK